MRYRDSMELPLDDVGVENGVMPCCRKHHGVETSASHSSHCLEGEWQSTSLMDTKLVLLFVIPELTKCIVLLYLVEIQLLSTQCLNSDRDRD